MSRYQPSGSVSIPICTGTTFGRTWKNRSWASAHVVSLLSDEAKGILWRNPSKEAAVEAFSLTLMELERLLQELTSNFYPTGSGMGVETLHPIYEFVSKVRKLPPVPAVKASRRKNLTVPQPSDTAEPLEEELGQLVRNALRDPSHEEWFRSTGKVEALIVELELAFSVRVTQPRRQVFSHKDGKKKTLKGTSGRRHAPSREASEN